MRERRLLGCASSDLQVASAFKQAAEDQSASGKGTVSVASVSQSNPEAIIYIKDIAVIYFFNFEFPSCQVLMLNLMH